MLFGADFSFKTSPLSRSSPNRSLRLSEVQTHLDSDRAPMPPRSADHDDAPRFPQETGPNLNAVTRHPPRSVQWTHGQAVMAGVYSSYPQTGLGLNEGAHLATPQYPSYNSISPDLHSQSRRFETVRPVIVRPPSGGFSQYVSPLNAQYHSSSTSGGGVGDPGGSSPPPPPESAAGRSDASRVAPHEGWMPLYSGLSISLHPNSPIHGQGRLFDPWTVLAPGPATSSPPPPHTSSPVMSQGRYVQQDVDRSVSRGGPTISNTPRFGQHPSPRLSSSSSSPSFGSSSLSGSTTPSPALPFEQLASVSGSIPSGLVAGGMHDGGAATISPGAVGDSSGAGGLQLQGIERKQKRKQVKRACTNCQQVIYSAIFRLPGSPDLLETPFFKTRLAVPFPTDIPSRVVPFYTSPSSFFYNSDVERLQRPPSVRQMHSSAQGGHLSGWRVQEEEEADPLEQ